VRVPLLPRWVRWLAVLGVGGFIFYVSIVTVPPETVVDDANPTPDLLPLDKWRHFVAYAALGLTLAYATTDWRIDTRILAVGVVVTVAIYGVGIEVGQSFIPERYLSPGDAYANAVGGILVVPYYAVSRHLDFTPLGVWLRLLSD
jgi:VanZ family protein